MSEYNSSFQTQHWILFCSNLRSKYPHSDSIVGIILGGRRRDASKDFIGCVDCPHHDNTNFRCARATTNGVIYKSHRHLDVNLYGVCVCSLTRVCVYKCSLQKEKQTCDDKERLWISHDYRGMVFNVFVTKQLLRLDRKNAPKSTPKLSFWFKQKLLFFFNYQIIGHQHLPKIFRNVG